MTKYDILSGIEHPTAGSLILNELPITEKMVKDFGYFIIETNKC
jgi:hypothetical protein